jgi:hypothetical protein
MPAPDLDQRDQRVVERLRWQSRQHRSGLAHDPVAGDRDEVLEDRFLAGVVTVERGFGDTEPRGDLPHRAAFIALLREDEERGVEYLPASPLHELGEVGRQRSA